MKRILFLLPLFSLIIACTGQPASQTVAQQTEEHKHNRDTISFTHEQAEFAGIKADRFIDTVLNANTDCIGKVELPPQSLASVSVPLGGFVKEIFIMPNQFVKRGQTVASIANPEYIAIQQSFLEFKALTEQLSAEYERQKVLASGEAASIKKLQQAKADHEVAKARLQSAEASLALLGIEKAEIEKEGIKALLPLRSPIAGYVTELNMNIGLHLNPDEIAMEIIEKSQLHLHLNVYEKDISRISIDDKIVYRLVSFPKQQFYATIESIGEKVMSEERSVIVIGHLDTFDRSLKTGMYVNAEILSKGKTVKALSQKAIVNSNNRWYVFSDEGSHYRRIEVERGMEQKEMVEIVNAETFPTDAKIVQSGAYYIQAEMMKRGE